MSERLTSWKNDPYVCLKATVGRLSSTTTWLNIWSKIQAMLIFIARWYSGWWLTYPSEKYESQLGGLFPIYGNIKHVPNHQPVLDARKPLSFPRVSKNSLSQGCSKPPTSFQIPHETYGLWHQLPGSDLGQLRHWPRAKNLNDVTKVGGFPGWSWVAWWLKKIKQLRRFSQLYLFYLSCFFWFLTQGISWFLGKSRGNCGQSECQDQDISTGEWEHVWGRRLIAIQRLGKIMENWLC